MMNIKRFVGLCLITAMPLTMMACKKEQSNKTAEPKVPAISRAIAILHPTTTSNIQGSLSFTKVEGGIKIEGMISGLNPGKHGIHVHEYGDGSSQDAMSAGDHFNPGGQMHGSPESQTHHTGDLGNIEADDNGVANVMIVEPLLSFEGPNSIVGRSVIVHEKEDDFTTQPSGASGSRIAWGVIGIARSLE